MTTLRPIGHLAGNLPVTAVTLGARVRNGHGNAVYLLWHTDDGCLWFLPAAHPLATSVVRSSPAQIINRYRNREGFGWRLILEDLQQTSAAYASAAMREAVA